MFESGAVACPKTLTSKLRITDEFGPVEIIDRVPVRRYSPKPAMRLVRILCAAYPEGVWVRRYRVYANRGGAR